MMNRQPYGLLLVCLAASCAVPSQLSADTGDVAAPAADETLIYVIREKRFAGGAVGYWIAVNDQTVARVRHKKHAIIRAKAGRITLNLAMQGYVVAGTTLDDRPGETVYLRFRLGDKEFTEIDHAEAAKLLKKSKLMDPLDAPRPNAEEIDALLNPSRLGLNLMRPTAHEPEADGEFAVLTIFRRDDGKDFEFGVWGEHEFLGTLKVNEGIRIRIPAGEHFFLSSNVGTTLLKAQAEAGKRYFAWLDFGKWIGRVRLTPVFRQDSSKLDEWLSDVNWVEIDSESITPRIQERVDMVTEYVRVAASRAAEGVADVHLLGSEHAY